MADLERSVYSRIYFNPAWPGHVDSDGIPTTVGARPEAEASRERALGLAREVIELVREHDHRDRQVEQAAEVREVPMADVPAHQLRDWWLQVAADEVDPLVAKMQEYGGQGRAVDLIDIGRAMIESGVDTGTGSGFAPADDQLSELGIYFYLVGKFARWKAAIAEGRQVSDDTLLDIGIYVRMAQRIRAVGGWPV